MRVCVCVLVSSPVCEKYVECISNDKLRSELAAFRLSAHNLDIERGRHIKVPRENRICRLCSMSMVGSEFHFLLAYGMPSI